MKTKGLFVALMALMMCFVTGEAYAYDIAVGNADGKTIYYNYINDTELEVTYKTTSYNSYSGSVVIPEEVTFMNMTRKVTSIGWYAFGYCSGLTSVTIPNSVTSIGGYAFSGCSGLTSVTIGNGVTSIESFAFVDCTGLTSVTIPNSVTSIGNGAFYDCSGLTSVTIPNSVTNIGYRAFYGCSGLTSVTIPNSVTNIGEWAFNFCSGLTSLSVESGNTVYDSRDNCNAIIKTSTNELIAGCQNTIIPNSVRSIGEYAFSGRSGLTSVTIPNSVTSIGSYAFDGCSGLTSVTIPNSVTSIGYRAFNSCSGLTSVTIGSGIKTISRYAFAYCSVLSDVYCYARSVPTTNTETFDNTNISAATLHVPASAIDSYSATAPWSGFGKKVALSTIGKCATPEISVVGGKLKFTCETEGVEFVPTVTFQNVQGTSQVQGNDEMVLAGKVICRVSVYATKDEYADSDEATMDVELNVGAKGDVNGDGAVSPADAIESLYIFFGVGQSSAPKKAEPQ